MIQGKWIGGGLLLATSGLVAAGLYSKGNACEYWIDYEPLPGGALPRSRYLFTNGHPAEKDQHVKAFGAHIASLAPALPKGIYTFVEICGDHERAIDIRRTGA
jgi:hypothetical protein